MKKVIAYIIGEYKKHRYFVRYCVIGASGASLDFVIFYILTSKLMLFYQYANIISISAGITNNFLWNAFLNFQTKDKIIKRFVSFYSVGLLGLGISAILLFAFIDLLHLNIIASKAVVIFVIVVVQYTLNKNITFKE